MRSLLNILLTLFVLFLASYYCAWNDVGHTLVDVVFGITLSGAREITSVDTQKYEDGDNPTLDDSSCRTVYANDPTILTLTVDPYVTSPGCGVRSVRIYIPILRFTVSFLKLDLGAECAQRI